MKINQSILSITLLSLGMVAAGTVLAEDVCNNHFGTLHCGTGSIDHIDYMGSVDIQGTQVTKSCDILGNASIASANINRLNIRGQTKMAKTTINGPMEVIGEMTMRESDVANATRIVGNYYGSHINFNSPLNIIGTLQCEICQFKGDTHVVGEMLVENSEFSNPLTIVSKKATFVNSKINDILAKKNNNNTNEPTSIYLKSGSEVKNITFEKQDGLVYLSNNAKISGKVIGGKIINE